MKKAILLVLFVLAVLMLSGCEEDANPDNNVGNYMEYELFYIGQMPCVWAEGYEAGGLTCD